MTKRKEAIKKTELHWSAFDEKIWGPTKLRALLDELKNEVEQGNVVSLERFKGQKRIDPHHWQKLIDQHPFFAQGIRIIKNIIYGKREQLVYDENKNSLMLKDLARYSEEHYQDVRRPVRDDHELKKDIEEIKIKLQAGDSNKSFEVNLFLDGKRIKDVDKKDVDE